MRRIKEVLRLRYELGLGQRQIARSCSIGQCTVFNYLRRAELRWPLPDGWDDERLERSLFAMLSVCNGRRSYLSRSWCDSACRVGPVLSMRGRTLFRKADEDLRLFLGNTPRDTGGSMLPR